jgi:hypothetical protein
VRSARVSGRRTIRIRPAWIDAWLEEKRLSLAKKHFSDVPLSAITATAISEFQRTRHEARQRQRKASK